ncbi:MAG: hypothetical protein P8Y71_22400 [Pseudolabrys sp.]
MRWPGWQHSCVVALALVVFVLAAGSARATPKPVHNVHSPELDALYAQILRHPQDTNLNLRFARAAEKAGVLRWALSAYERVTVNNPANAEAQAGLQRIRRKLQPDVSQVTLAFGTAVETNPRYYVGPKRTEGEGLASAILYDERSIGDMRWRTTGAVNGRIYSKSHDLDYGKAILDTGPVIDILPGWAMVPTVGGAAAYYDHHFFYGEGAVGATFESATQRAFRSLQLRAAYRSYDKFFPTSSGFYMEARGHLAFPNLLGNGSVLILSPWARYSDMSGTYLSPLVGDLQPGAYWELGGKVEALKPVTSWLTLGAELSAIQRHYRADRVATTGAKRNDTLLIPGATVLFPHVFSYRTNVRVTYHYIHDHSNDSSKSFDDHVVMASLVYRFDPRILFAAPAEPAR